MVAGNHLFQGIGQIEAQDRSDEYRTGVPALGSALTLLLHAPATAPRGRLTGVQVVNSGELRAELRLRHQGQVKTVTTEQIVAFDQGGDLYVGRLQFGAITPGSFVATEAGALADVVDNGLGVLHDIGIPANTRGTINYVTGVISLQWPGAVTQPATVAYTHTDYTDFVSPAQTSPSITPPGGTGTGGVAEVFSTGTGRVNPGSVSFSTNGGALTFVDDGKGTIVETTGGSAAVAGTIDYATGTITVDTASLALTAVAFTVAFTFNPFATLLAGGAASKLLDTFGSPIPELTQQPWAAGLKDENRVGLVGACTEAGANGTDLVTQWAHFGEDPFRVETAFSGFPPGGAVAVSGNANA